MTNRTQRWFLKLLVFPFIILKNASNVDASERENFSDSIWFTFGILPLPLTIVLLHLGYQGVLSAGWCGIASSICIIFYLAIGVASFFSEKMTNSNIPWQNNGRW